MAETIWSVRSSTIMNAQFRCVVMKKLIVPLSIISVAVLITYSLSPCMAELTSFAGQFLL